MRICWANTENYDESNVVILGVPDESKSHSLRKGTSEAPHKIREISNIRDTYKRGSDISTGFPLGGINTKVYDYGNILRTEVSDAIGKISSKSKIPITIGGDHSISTDIIKSLSKRYGSISLVYFDAHPDFISSSSGYYGSVLHDVLPDIDTKSSIQIGIRTPEQEEIDNIKKHDLSVITPWDVLKNGITEIEKTILGKIGKNTYISVDMDAIDPAYAPGVSVPVPLGLGNLEVVYLLKSIVKRGIVGLDIMEVCPGYDIKDRTSHLASRMIAEVISAIN
ncbi:Agmatinase [Candidatus Nitrosotalea sp. TS]|uniref:arginase family protein n=1 Tax=Candidatus Nitrosotalea sp. TS TaxID=2341020 RepID=UPI00140A8625|nr:arginase family protein [Candidatus Nitrosotalea sp. TS]NHI02445.1 Agmatinase [Candidatus Nitrosotalea sp. TS]